MWLRVCTKLWPMVLCEFQWRCCISFHASLPPCNKPLLTAALCFCRAAPTELRKERAERAPGGVTPGDDMYYAAAARARAEGPASGPSYSSNDLAGGAQDVLGLGNARAQQQQHQQQHQQQQVPQQQYVQRAPPPGGSYITNRSRHPGNPGGVAGGAGLVQYEWDGPDGAGGLGPEDEEELELEHEHGELMESILEDEEEIIALHRQQIEDAMEVVRRSAGRERRREGAVGTGQDAAGAAGAACQRGCRQSSCLTVRTGGVCSSSTTVLGAV